MQYLFHLFYLLRKDFVFQHCNILPDVLEEGHDEVKGAVLPLGPPEPLLSPEAPGSPLPRGPCFPHRPPLTFTELALGAAAAIAGPGCQDVTVKILLDDVSLSLCPGQASSSRGPRKSSGTRRARRARGALRSRDSAYIKLIIQTDMSLIN